MVPRSIDGDLPATVAAGTGAAATFNELKMKDFIGKSS